MAVGDRADEWAAASLLWRGTLEVLERFPCHRVSCGIWQDGGIVGISILDQTSHMSTVLLGHSAFGVISSVFIMLSLI